MTDLKLSALGLRQVAEARDRHDRTCPWQKPAKEVHIHPDGIEAFGWEAGDMIAGIEVVPNDKVPRQRMRVYCEGDIPAEPEPRLEQEVDDRVLVPA